MYNVCVLRHYVGRKIPESSWGSPIPIGDGDGDVNLFPDGDGDGDGDETEKRGWGWFSKGDCLTLLVLDHTLIFIAFLIEEFLKVNMIFMSTNSNNSNPFDALNSVKNDEDLGTDGGNSKADGKGSLNVAPDSSSTTHIVEKIDNLERQILDEKLMFLDNDENSLYKANSKGIVDSDSEMEEVFNETAGYMASTSLKSGSDRGYGTNSLLEQ
ncbi:hypothetical protein Tco_0888808 [Tanacetum coccineum]